MIRVALDARRQRDNGIARVTRLLASALGRLPVSLVLLGPVDELRNQFPETELIEYGPPLLSKSDLYGLSAFLETLAIDCFVAPQFYNSPWTSCPQVRILHDTFPFEPGARLPTALNAERAFGSDSLRDVSDALLVDIPLEERRWVENLYRAYYDLAITNAGALLTVSESSLTSLERHFPASAGKVEILPLAADPALVNGVPPEINNRPIDVIHVSKFEPRKNQLKMLDGWSMLAAARPSFRACIVGSPSTLFQDCGDQVMQIIERAQNDGWLEYHRAIDDHSLGELYRASKILCAPSTAEGFGLPALEGISNGCALLTLPGTAIDEICGAEAIHVANSAEAIAEQITRLLDDPAYLKKRSTSAWNHAATFSLDRTADVLMRAIDRTFRRD